MDFNPGDDQLVLLGREFASQNSSIFNRVNGYLALILSMDMWHVVFIRIIEKHPDKDAVNMDIVGMATTPL